MISCLECGKNYSIKERALMLKNIEKEIVCGKCNTKFKLNKKIFNIVFWLTVIIYISLNYKLKLFLENLGFQGLSNDLLKIIIGITGMYFFIFIISFFLKGNPIKE